MPGSPCRRGCAAFHDDHGHCRHRRGGNLSFSPTFSGEDGAEEASPPLGLKCGLDKSTLLSTSAFITKECDFETCVPHSVVNLAEKIRCNTLIPDQTQLSESELGVGSRSEASWRPALSTAWELALHTCVLYACARAFASCSKPLHCLRSASLRIAERRIFRKIKFFACRWRPARRLWAALRTTY